MADQPWESSRQRLNKPSRAMLIQAGVICWRREVLSNTPSTMLDLRSPFPEDLINPGEIYIDNVISWGTCRGLDCPLTVGCSDDGYLSSDHAIVPASRCVVDLSLHALRPMQPTATAQRLHIETLS